MSFYIFLTGYWIIYIKDDDRQMWFYIHLLSIDMYLSKYKALEFENTLYAVFTGRIN